MRRNWWYELITNPPVTGAPSGSAREIGGVALEAGQHVITAADPLSDDLRQALDAINRPS